jgi:protein O-GlcNAc transferase
MGRGVLELRESVLPGAGAAIRRRARLHAKLILCDWTNLESEIAHLLSAIERNKLAIAPFSLMALPSSPAHQLAWARTFVQEQGVFPEIWRKEIYSHERIRVAYVSADFREHATAFLTAGLFEAHDKSRFKITAISFGPDDNSNIRSRIKRACDHFVDVRHNSDQEVAELIRRREIDIAVDLMGFVKNNRLNIFARRPAPIQVNYLGYPGTMRASYIDYILADSTVIPSEHIKFYAEEVIRLPETYQINDSLRAIASRMPSRSECGLPEKAFVFCCFNNNYKIMPEIFDIWMRLLRVKQDSVLWLLDANAAAVANLRQQAERRGITSQRLIFAPKMTLADHLARYRQADLFLDTLPVNAHTTASDALWAGVPVLTCLGATFAGRVAASLLNAAGLKEMVTRSLDEYEALALKLADDSSALAAVRQRLASQGATCALFDTGRVTRQIEAAYVMMWERYQKGA